MVEGSPDVEAYAAKGLQLCREGDWDRGLQLLSAAAEAKGARELPGVVYAYLGYGAAKYQRRTRDGLKLCEHAVKIQYYEPENHLQLARVQLLMGDRKGAVGSIARGLKLDPNHRELKDLRFEIGVRKRPVLPFLDRKNPLNVLLGQLRSLLKRRDD
ncbi:MAG: hypothetical protein AMXMBFR36_36420 [Acidobacteriota bacterium]